MTERGSFVTEYIYCDKCFEAAKTVLLEKSKSLCSTAIPHWGQNAIEGDYLPIIAGKISHTWSESHFIENEIGPELAKVICHPMRIAVIRDGGGDADTIVINPTGGGQ